MNDYKISIIIPVFNVENYLDACMSSVLSLDSNLVEIILINDGSTDKSGQLCQKYAMNSDNIKYFEQRNQGLSEARNTGIKNANGEYLLFLDSDDYLYTKAFPRLMEDISKSDDDIFIGRAFEFEDGTENYKLCQTDYSEINTIDPKEVFIHLDSIDDFWFAAWLIIIKRSFLIDNNLYFKKGIYHEDELWVPSVFVKSKRCGLLNYGFYCYRLNRLGSIINTPNIKREFDKLQIVDEFDILILENKSCSELLRKRQAALVFGILTKLKCFASNEEYEELALSVNQHKQKLRFGKYKKLYWLVCILGIKNISRLIRLS